MIWNLKELQENANTVASNKQVKDLLEDHYWDDEWFYFYDQEKQVKYVSDVNTLCSWNVYALLKAGHAYAITGTGDDKVYLVYCYNDVDSSDGSGSSNASYECTLMTLDATQSFDSPEDIFNNENIINHYYIPSITKIEDLGENSVAKDLASLVSVYDSKQESYFNPEYKLLGKYEGYHYSHINTHENGIKIVLSGKDNIELSISDYLVALAETEGIKQLDLAFKDYGISYKLEINK